MVELGLMYEESVSSLVPDHIKAFACAASFHVSWSSDAVFSCKDAPFNLASTRISNKKSCFIMVFFDILMISNPFLPHPSSA